MPQPEINDRQRSTIIERYKDGDTLTAIAYDLSLPLDAVQRLFTQIRAAKPDQYKRLEKQHLHRMRLRHLTSN